MRSVRIGLVGLSVAALGTTGCETLKRLGSWTRPPANTAVLADRDPGQFVTYLNQQAGYLQSIRYDDVAVSARGPDGPMPRLTEGTLACSKPRNFRMISGHLLTSGSEVDLGSNDQEFWMFVKRPDPTLLYASHDDYAAGRAALPIPFETDWVLEALGMSTYDPNLAYTADADQKDRVYTLSWDDRTPQGEAVRKVIVFSGDRESGERPQVRKHVVLDAARNVVASAEITEVERRVVPAPPNSQQADMTYTIPTHVVLEWPQQKFKMDLTLAKPRVNEPFSDAEYNYFFRRPDIPGANEVNLATANIRPTSSRAASYRGSTPGSGHRPRFFGSLRAGTDRPPGE